MECLSLCISLNDWQSSRDNTKPWKGILATDSQSLLNSILETLPETTSTTDRADKRVKQVASLKVEGPERDIVSNIAAILATQLGKKLYNMCKASRLSRCLPKSASPCPIERWWRRYDA